MASGPRYSDGYDYGADMAYAADYGEQEPGRLSRDNSLGVTPRRPSATSLATPRRAGLSRSGVYEENSRSMGPSRSASISATPRSIADQVATPRRASAQDTPRNSRPSLTHSLSGGITSADLVAEPQVIQVAGLQPIVTSMQGITPYHDSMHYGSVASEGVQSVGMMSSQYAGSTSAYATSVAYPTSVYAESARFTPDSARTHYDNMRYAQSEAGYPVAGMRTRPDTGDLSDSMSHNAGLSHHPAMADGSAYLSPRSMATGRETAVLAESPKGSEYSSPYSRKYYRSQMGYSTSDMSSQGYTPRLSIMYSPKGSSSPRASRSSTPRSRRSDRLVHSRGGDMAYNIPAADHDILGIDGYPLGKDGYNTKDAYDMFHTVEEQDLHSLHPSPTITKTNWLGLLCFLFYLGCAFFYFYVRIAYTLDMGFPGYGITVFVIEVIAFTSTIGYGILLCRMTISAKTEGLNPAPRGYIPDDNTLKFHVRVLVPCYKESLEIVEATCRAAIEADLPFMTKRTLYLCDDGNDPAKREMVERMGPDCVYVTGRVRDPLGETNGKSNNLNNCLKMIYPEGAEIPTSEVVVVFDADMVAQPNFYLKALECMIEDRIALTLTPQGFHNVSAQRDIFNNLNLSFWEYILPGCDAFGYIACTGTNFIIRARELAVCGFFPTFTITEDYALGMIMKARGCQARYLNEYLAIGEAPEEIRNIFRQRSRWCKGQMQVLFSKSCPLFFPGLPIFHKWLYTSVTWCYITNTLTVPFAVMVPFIAMVFGIYPLVLNEEFALGSTLFFTASSLINMFSMDRRHIKPMWFCVVACNLLWWTFCKATFMTLFRQIFRRRLTFKTTKKKGVNDEVTTGSGCLPQNLGDMEGTFDHWVVILGLLINTVTLAAAIYQIADAPYTAQGDFRWYLLLSGFWAVYNSMPAILFMFYIYNKGPALSVFATVCLVSTYLCAIGALICIWMVPSDYDAGQVLDLSLKFVAAQRSGKLPRDNPYPFITDSAMFDSIVLPNGRNVTLVGGYYHDGGFLKLSYPIAISTAFLAWGFIEFNQGYTTSNNDAMGATVIQWGADYLQKAHLTNFTSAGVPLPDWFVAQVGDVKTDNSFWGRAKDMPLDRPVYVVDPTRPSSDLLGAAAAALAASSRAISAYSPQQASVYLSRAVRLYSYATKYLGSYTKWVPAGGMYNSTSYYDDLAWAACWLYAATNDATYLNDAVTYHATSLQNEQAANQDEFTFNWQNVLWGVDMLLYDFTKNPMYNTRMQNFAATWKIGREKHVQYTQKKLAIAIVGPSLQHTANAAMWMALYARRLPSSNYMEYLCWVRSQIGYMLGDGGRSYVVGYSNGYPQKIPHRAASCAQEGDCTWDTAYYSTQKNPNILYGALVGGPNLKDEFVDQRDMYSIANSVGILNNAGFTSSLAALRYDNINMAKCEQGNGMIQNIMLKVQGTSNIPGLRWWQQQ